MAINRIEAITYGVEDLQECQRFWQDVGLELVESSGSKASFRTPVNQYVHLRRADDPELPPAMEAGSTVREVIWGVDDQQTLDEIKAELARDRQVVEDADGRLHTTDYIGYAIGFAIANPERVAVAPRGYNLGDKIARLNQPAKVDSEVRPLRLIHIAYDAPHAGHDEANQFYIQRLKFRPTDIVKKVGTFMHCEGDREHHNLLLCHRSDRTGINHVAVEVRDMDEVILAGNRMNERGWKESRRLGRHTIGSNVFRMCHNPCGGRLEFASDMDRMDDDYQPRTWEETPPHNVWMLKQPAGEA